MKNKTMLLLIMVVVFTLMFTGCMSKKGDEEVSAPNEENHIVDIDESQLDEQQEQELDEEDVKESKTEQEQNKLYEDYYIKLSQSYSTKEAVEFLDKNIKYFDVGLADKSILDLEETLKKNQSYYIDKVMAEKVQLGLSEAYYNSDDLKIDNISLDSAKLIVQEALDEGYKFFPEDGVIYPIIDYDKLSKYNEYLSDEMVSYLGILVNDTNSEISFAENSKKAMDELEKRLITVENHLTAYPEGSTFDTMYDAYEMYLKFYVISLVSMDGVDTETDKISDELLSHYKAFVKNHPYFFTTDILKDYLDKLEQNDNIVNDDVKEYLDGFNSVIVKHVSKITNK